MRETLGMPLYHVALNRGSMRKSNSPLRSSHSPSKRIPVAPFENSFVRPRRNEGLFEGGGPMGLSGRQFRDQKLELDRERSMSG